MKSVSFDGGLFGALARAMEEEGYSDFVSTCINNLGRKVLLEDAFTSGKYLLHMMISWLEGMKSDRKAAFWSERVLSK